MELSFDAAISQLRNTLANFTQSYNRFMANAETAKKDPQLWADWQAAKAKADAVAGSIRWINSQVDSAVDWFSSTVGGWFGLSGLRGIAGLNSGLGQMGVLPLIPIAYITGAIAALVAAIGYMNSVSGRAEELRARIALAQQTGDTSIITGWDQSQAGGGFWDAKNIIPNLAGLAIVGVAAYFLLPQLMKKRG